MVSRLTAASVYAAGCIKAQCSIMQHHSHISDTGSISYLIGSMHGDAQHSCTGANETASTHCCCPEQTVQRACHYHTWLALSTERFRMAARVQVRHSSTAGLLRMSFSYSMGWSAPSKVRLLVRPASEAPWFRKSYLPLHRCTKPACNRGCEDHWKRGSNASSVQSGSASSGQDSSSLRHQC